MTVAVLGLILLAAAGVLTAAVVTSNTGAVETDLWNATISNLSLGVVFVAGMLTTIVGVIGIVMLTAGVRRNQRLRQERRVLRRENQRLTQRVEAGPAPDDEPTATYPVADEPVEPQPRRGLFAPRRSTTDTRVDTGGRHLDHQDRVVAGEPVDGPDTSATTETAGRSS
jgi:uncharacterized integral membrane protein